MDKENRKEGLKKENKKGRRNKMEKRKGMKRCKVGGIH